MIQSNMAPLGMAVTPHHLASESALAVLRDGGNAIEAMVAAAATIAVVYPHMNGLGGDGFWLIMPGKGDPIAIDASGRAGSLATIDFYQGETQIPHRGPKAALTVAGTVSGWHEALTLSAELGGTSLSLPRLLRDAVRYAADGIPVTASQAAATRSKREELQHQPGFSALFLPDGDVPAEGSRFTQPDLARTLSLLSEEGLESFIVARWRIIWQAKWLIWVFLSPWPIYRSNVPAGSRRCMSAIAKGISGISRRRHRGWFLWRSWALPIIWIWPMPMKRKPFIASLKPQKSLCSARSAHHRSPSCG